MPRKTYILPKDYDAPQGSARGGVGSISDDDWEYDLEVGQAMNCDTRMLALAAHVDEMYSLLAITFKHDPIAALVKKSWDEVTYQLDKQLKEAKEQPREE